MTRRARWHDYRAPGAYMLTLVVEGRRPVLGRLMLGEAIAEHGTQAYVEPSELGVVIRRDVARRMTERYPQVEVWQVCIMPDHIHLIVRVTAHLPEGKHLGHVVAGFKRGCNIAYRELCPVPCDCFAGSGKGLFEKGYNDRLLFDGEQLKRWRHYLDDNPRRLAMKRVHPELFTVMHGRPLCGHNCQLIGNLFLLDIPDKVAVIVHRADTDEDFARKKAEWLACGERGGVIVSAAIAKREKEVMREAMDRDYNIILLRENGFPKLYKPSGEAFDACARGQLLQVSPWEYHMDGRTITRQQCLTLNSLAEEIAGG